MYIYDKFSFKKVISIKNVMVCGQRFPLPYSYLRIIFGQVDPTRVPINTFKSLALHCTTLHFIILTSSPAPRGPCPSSTAAAAPPPRTDRTNPTPPQRTRRRISGRPHPYPRRETFRRRPGGPGSRRQGERPRRAARPDAESGGWGERDWNWVVSHCGGMERLVDSHGTLGMCGLVSRCEYDCNVSKNNIVHGFVCCCFHACEGFYGGTSWRNALFQK